MLIFTKLYAAPQPLHDAQSPQQQRSHSPVLQTSHAAWKGRGIRNVTATAQGATLAVATLHHRAIGVGVGYAPHPLPHATKAADSKSA